MARYRKMVRYGITSKRYDSNLLCLDFANPRRLASPIKIGKNGFIVTMYPKER